MRCLIIYDNNFLICLLVNVVFFILDVDDKDNLINLNCMIKIDLKIFYYVKKLYYFIR